MVSGWRLRAGLGGLSAEMVSAVRLRAGLGGLWWWVDGLRCALGCYFSKIFRSVSSCEGAKVSLRKTCSLPCLSMT